MPLMKPMTIIVLPDLEFAPGILTGIASALLLRWNVSVQLTVTDMSKFSTEIVKAESSYQEKLS